MLPWAGYIRVSDRHGRSGDSYRSVKDQREAIQRWVDARGEAVVILAEEENESGGRVDRPILLEAVSGVESGLYGGVVAAYQSRLWRDSATAQAMRARVMNAGGQIALADRGIVKETPEDTLLFNVVGAFDQMEREKHSQRFKAQNESAVRRGVWPMPTVPYGFVKDPVTRSLVPGPNAPEVLKAFEDKVAGVRTHDQIAIDLGMSASFVDKMFRNRVYIGELRRGDAVNPDGHEAIVPLELFESAAAVRGRRPIRTKGEVQGLVVGIVRCQGCGHMMKRKYLARSTDFVYECRRVHAEGRCPAPAQIMGKRLDHAAEQVALAELAKLTVRAAAATDRTLDLRAAVKRAQMELSDYLAAVSATDVGAEAFRAGATDRRSAIITAQEDLEAALRVDVALPNISDGVEAWASMNTQERNTLLRGLFDCIVVRRVGQGRRVALGERIRIFAHGTLRIERSKKRRPLVELPFPDLDDERVLWVASAEDRLKSASS